ncbi:MAG TPA: flavin reductase family protein [Pseudonocardiaceae bacterium]|nr:flavin reductase family protein [Pseudonocardiaceae bacterium]
MDAHSTFDELVVGLEYSMFIVTVRVGGQRAGCLVGFGCQSSIHPPRFLICLSPKNHTYRVAMNADVVAVHFVPRRAEALARLFGGRTGDEVDKFAHCAWRPGPAGLPILGECRNWFAGRVLDRLNLGDHVGYQLEPIAAQREAGEPYFTFHQAMRIQPGHPA